MNETVAERWFEILSQPGPAHQRVNHRHLELFYGSDPQNRPVFFLQSRVKPELTQLSDAVTLELLQRPNDGRWTLLLTLLDMELCRPFISLCSQMVQDTSQKESESAALAALYDTLAKWRSLLKLTSAREATQEQLRGLFAELWVANYVLQIPTRDAIDAWVGPYGAAQDFRMRDGHAYEVKAVHPGARSIDISSAEQLDTTETENLTLLLVTLQESERTGDGYFSVPAVVRKIRQVLISSGGLSESFDHRLAALDFDPEDRRNDAQAFLAIGVKRFRVEDAFPRVSRAAVPTGVSNVRYRISISSMSQFEHE